MAAAAAISSLLEPASDIIIDIPGLLVVPKERHRGQQQRFTPPRTVVFERTVRDHARLAMRGRGPFRCAVEAEITVVLPVPRSWRKAYREAALAGRIMPTRKPDIDNAIKGAMDALNGVVYQDDRVIVRSRQEKIYGPLPRIILAFRRIPGVVGSSQLLNREVELPAAVEPPSRPGSRWFGW
ncbi:MAG: RusA family crossover junction endodeoxyribonuclease [Erythrobacter sp.]